MSVALPPEIRTEYGRLLHGDCLEWMKRIPTGIVDMVMVDLPYGTTECTWDSIIPLEKLWPEYYRVCKEDAAMVFTCAQPFTTTLIASNRKHFRYCWYWIKNKPTAFASSHHQPMRCVEDVAVFYRKAPTYNPQGLTKIPPHKLKTMTQYHNPDSVYAIERDQFKGKVFRPEHTGYPNQTLYIDCQTTNIHSTQKPVSLMIYLIKTYTDPGQVVLDNTCGSGTTAEACILTRRRFVCIERDDEIFEVARKRIAGVNPGFGAV